MEVKQIKELMAAMGRTGVMRLSIKKEDFELELERDKNSTFRADQIFDPEELSLRSELDSSSRTNIALSKAGSDLAASKMAAKTVEAVEKEEAAGSYITSPMVGTYYASPSPDDPPFVKIGDKVDKNTVVCIVEAMKVMNEVKANVSGTVTEVLAESGHPVEFGTKLFRIS